MNQEKTKKSALFLFAIFVVLFLVFVYFDVRRSHVTNLYEIKNEHIGKEDYQEGFVVSPVKPTAWNPTNWDIQAHTRDQSSWLTLPPFTADYGTDCTPPPATHLVTSFAETVFECQNRLLTAINTASPAVIYLTPNRLVDFSEHPASIKFELNSARQSAFDWVDFWVSPLYYQLTLPFEDSGLDLQGPPEQFVHIKMEDKDGQTLFRAYGNQGEIGSCNNCSLDRYINTKDNKLVTFEIKISATHLSFGLPEQGVTLIDANMAPLTWTQGVVQFGTHNSGESCSNCQATTWVWDNVEINPALPFTIIRGQSRYVNKDNSVVTFPKPSPANSHLRFSGIGKNLEFSFDGGKNWQAAGKQTHQSYIEERFNSYWFVIPAGVRSVQFRGNDWWGGPWLAQDFSVWSSEYNPK